MHVICQVASSRLTDNERERQADGHGEVAARDWAALVDVCHPTLLPPIVETDIDLSVVSVQDSPDGHSREYHIGVHHTFEEEP
jgi:hypothetical protein